MRIMLSKFGDTLISRQAGKEAYGAFRPVLQEIKSDETIIIDFAGVVTFSPSWGDEFITPLFERFGDHIEFVHATNNPSVRITLQLLEKIKGKSFIIREDKE